MGAAKKVTTFKSRRKKPSYEREVENLLREYPLMQSAIQDVDQLLPSCVPSYQTGAKGYSQYQSTTEKYGILRAVRSKKNIVRQIEKALAQLTEEELQVIELKYFDRLPVARICYLLHTSEATYKRRRNNALKKIAKVMNLI
jgi:RNA polymerase sigma factor (sigma-70 family)